MPCYDGPRDTRQDREIAELTEMLCEAGNVLRAAGLIEQASPGLRTWVELHEARDRERELAKKLEEIRRKAGAK